MVKINKLHYPITVYTLYTYGSWIDHDSYERQFMITNLHGTYKANLVRKAVALIDLDNLSDLKGSHLYRAVSILKNATDYEDNVVEYVGYVNCIFVSLLKQKVPHLEVKTHTILTDGSVEY